MKGFSFSVSRKNTETAARVGTICTPHGKIHTPAFVPVGTQATVKSLTPEELRDIGTQLFFVNTYHIYLHPGVEVIGECGGLHKFMNWTRPLITDSGGFQVFSLGKKKYINIAISESAVLDRERFTKKISKKTAIKDHVYPDDYKPVGELVKIDEAGVTFTSHWDGSTHRFTPEISIAIQHTLGADLIIAFDECASYPSTHTYARAAMERTHRWAIRSLEAHKKTKSSQALYGVIQGGIYKDLRMQSADVISTMAFDGIAIGGVSVGESKEEMRDVLTWVMPHLPEEKPRHLLGVGEIDDIFALVEAGIDTFDCVQPTRLARMGKIYVNKAKNQKSKAKRIKNNYMVDITKKMFAEDKKPLDPDCSCYTCTHYSRSYIHHLFRVRELLAYRLATYHNLYFVHQLVQNIREALVEGTFVALKNQWI